MTKNGQRRETAIRPMHYASSRHRGLPAEIVTRKELLERFPPRFLDIPERLHFHILVLAERGRGFHWVDFERLTMAPRLLVHIAPGQVQRYDLSRRFEARLLVLPSAIRLHCNPAGKGSAAGGRWRLDRESAVDFARLFDEFEREQARFDGSKTSKDVIRSLVGVARARLARLGEADPDRSPLSPLYREFEALVEARFAERPTASRLARELSCSARTLSRAVHRARGVSPKAFLDERTALEAKRLLAYRNAKTATLAAELGFPEVTHFVRFFRRLVGETPASFRARWWRPPS